MSSSGLPLIPCSKYSRQILSHGRPYMSGYSYWIVSPGRDRRVHALHREDRRHALD